MRTVSNITGSSNNPRDQWFECQPLIPMFQTFLFRPLNLTITQSELYPNPYSLQITKCKLLEHKVFGTQGCQNIGVSEQMDVGTQIWYRWTIFSSQMFFPCGIKFTLTSFWTELFFENAARIVTFKTCYCYPHDEFKQFENKETFFEDDQ